MPSGIVQHSNQHPYVHDGHLLRVTFIPTYTLTLETDGHGTLSASNVTGHAGDTVTLTATNDDYYRFTEYQVTGGTLNGNTFTFGNENAKVKASFHANSFLTSGGWYRQPGASQSTTSTETTYTDISPKYPVLDNPPANIPSSWYSGENNRFQPASHVSGFSITLAPNFEFWAMCESANGSWAGITGAIYVGHIGYQTKTYSFTADNPGYYRWWTYDQVRTTNNTAGPYYFSGRMASNAKNRVGPTVQYDFWRAAGSTWTASGYIK